MLQQFGTVPKSIELLLSCSSSSSNNKKQKKYFLKWLQIEKKIKERKTRMSTTNIRLRVLAFVVSFASRVSFFEFFLAGEPSKNLYSKLINLTIIKTGQNIFKQRIKVIFFFVRGRDFEYRTCDENRRGWTWKVYCYFRISLTRFLANIN